MQIKKLSKNWYTILTRRKPLVESSTTPLAKVLSTIDLTALGIGSTLGVGIYVLAGEVSKSTAGPAVIISFMIAAIASVFAGLCYAEFGARVPKAGSAYIYSYVTIGELMAYFIGWNLILEYSIGAASVVKGLSTYTDSLLNKAISNFFLEHVPMNSIALGDYVDFFAFGITMVFAVGIALGASESSLVNTLFTMTNLAVVLYVVITGSFKADPLNWQIPAEEVPEGFGEGGFAPYGISGIIKGGAICFYGFIGFDVIATAGEEAKDPKRSIPLAVIISLTIIFIAYFSISTVLTMMLPYYLQNNDSPLPHVFNYYGWYTAEYIVSFGAIFGLCSSLMGSMFSLPRVIYAMSRDGLIFEFMGRTHPRFKTPFIGTILAGLITGAISAIFNLNQLVSMMSIGTLLAYSMVAACVLLLRFEIDEDFMDKSDEAQKPITVMNVIRQLWNGKQLKHPTKVSAFLVTWGVTFFWLVSFLLSSIVSFLGDDIMAAEWYAILLLIVSFGLVVGTLVVIQRQPRSTKELSFSVPLVPWLPGLSILINVYLMLQLDSTTWIRFCVWIAAGFAIYFGYGIRKSKENPKVKQRLLQQEELNNDNEDQIDDNNKLQIFDGNNKKNDLQNVYENVKKIED